MNYNELSKAVYKNAIEKGFWNEPKSDEHCLMLVITEVAEAIEADRKGKHSVNADVFDSCLKDWVLDADVVFKCEFERLIKDTVEDEFADIAIRLLDLAAKRKIELGGIDHAIINWDDFKNAPFTELAYNLCTILCSTEIKLQIVVVSALFMVIEWTKHLGIDLKFHIEQKMKYNSMREPMHGKKY